MQLFDKITIDDAAKVRKTPDGYLVAQPRVARSGIQLYSGDEVGKPDKKVVRIYRPSEEVFHNDSMHSYAFRPLTNDHPHVPVNSDNWKDFSIGQTGPEVLRDGEYIRVPLVLMDASSIALYDAGKRELSLGYTCDLKWEAGQTADGESYDAIQTNIRANHLALVAAARGGPSLRIGDKQEEDNMTVKTVVVDGFTVNTDDNGAMIINRVIDGLSKQLKDAKELADATIATLRKEIETKDGTIKENGAKIATLETQVTTLDQKVKDAELTPAKLDAAVVARAEVIGKARGILGDKLVTDGKTDGEIRKQVVDAKMGDKAKGWGDAEYMASFVALTADVKVNSTNDGKATDVAAIFGGSNSQINTNDADKAYAEMITAQQDAWKTPVKAA